MFVDSDDFIAQNSLEGLYKVAQERNADVVVFDLVHGDVEGKKKETLYFKNIVDKYGSGTFNAETPSRLFTGLSRLLHGTSFI